MNAVEIEQEITALAEQPFDAAEFPFQFLQAFAAKATTLKRLRVGATNKSDVGGVLQTKNIHIVVAEPGAVTEALATLRDSPATKRHRARFILATDGDTFEAEDLETGDTQAGTFERLPDAFGFFLPLAGISTVKVIRENAFDIRATSRLNKLYLELLKDNPDWAAAERRHDLNHFFARLIFCFFAEDTAIFRGDDLFTQTVAQFSQRDAANTHEVIAAIFQAMDVPIAERKAAALPGWADGFPYVNGGLFKGDPSVPRFSRIAQKYLVHIGQLDWTRINPDIFGSMIQAVADDDERGRLGMHYTSVPNILKVLNPLFLDDLRTQLDAAGDNGRKLLNLRRRMSRIRVFDPACGSGNFLVIAYKEMRAVEAEVNRRRGEAERASDIPLTNFRGIEIRDFACEVARLALIIAEYQCDVLYRGDRLALAEFLPLDAENWITCGNALRIDWLSVCPPTGTGVKVQGDDLFETPLEQSEIDFENEGGETYICGNPPYLGSKWQSAEQKADLARVFGEKTKGIKSLDYVAGWFVKGAHLCALGRTKAALVSTNSVCQGQQVPILWPILFGMGCHIDFARLSFKWANLATHNAGVTVVVVALTTGLGARQLFEGDESRTVENINAYLIAAPNVEVRPRSTVPDTRAKMQFGNHPYYGTPLIMSASEGRALTEDAEIARFLRPLYGSKEFIDGLPRACLWIADGDVSAAQRVDAIQKRLDATAASRRRATKDKAAQSLANEPHRFRDRNEATSHVLIAPRVSSERRDVLPVGLLSAESVIQDQAFALYDAPLWNLALIASRIHLVWIATVCGKLETRYRYSNTLGWNTFPVPTLTQKNRDDLTATAEAILLAREAHFPATIADLYDPEAMPEDLRAAHEANDETLERIYIGRRFRNDTERLEKLFSMYVKMTTKEAA